MIKYSMILLVGRILVVGNTFEGTQGYDVVIVSWVAMDCTQFKYITLMQWENQAKETPCRHCS